MKTVVVLQQKGGVGKTTVALNIAFYVAQHGKRVSIADADPQGSIRTNLDALDGLTIVSMDRVFSDTVDAEFLVIDTSPRNDADLFRILDRTDFVLMPVRPGFLDVLAMRDTVSLIEQYQTERNRTIPAGIVLNMVQHRNALNADTATMLNSFEVPLLPVKLYLRVAYARTLLTAGVMNSTDEKAKAEIEELVTEILDRL